MPEIGVGRTSRNEPLENSEAEILKQLPIHHLRAELKLFDKNFSQNLKLVSDESSLLGIPLFLVLYFSKNFKNELAALKNAIRFGKISVKYILDVGENHLSNDIIFEEIYFELKELFPKAKIGTGVNAYFAELNRNRPQTERAEFVSFAVCPQVHAFDNISLVENLEAQKYVVNSAKKLFPGKPVFVSPVTLKQRFNVVATAEEPAAKSGELPDQVDARQNTVFAAQWLLGSLKFLSQSGTDLVTFFETVGWRGFIQGNYIPTFPEKFSALKGDIFPVFQFLKELAGYDEIVYSESSVPLKLEGIVLANKNNRLSLTAIIVNFDSEAGKIKVEGFFEVLGIQSLFSKETIITENNDIIIPGGSVVRVELKLVD